MKAEVMLLIGAALYLVGMLGLGVVLFPKGRPCGRS